MVNIYQVLSTNYDGHLVMIDILLHFVIDIKILKTTVYNSA